MSILPQSPSSIYGLADSPIVYHSINQLPVFWDEPSWTEQPKDTQDSTIPPIPIDFSSKKSALKLTTFSLLDFSWMQWTMMIWLLGVVLLGVWRLRINYRFARLIRKQRVIEEPSILKLLEECKRCAGIETRLQLIETSAVTSPALIGIWRPRLLLPSQFESHFTFEDLKYIFLHELSHLKARDVVVNSLATFLQTIHWFNPILWIAFKRIRIDRELACDERALTFSTGIENKNYGHTLLKVLEWNQNFYSSLDGVVGILEDKKQIYQRITLINQFCKKSRVWSVTGIVLMISLSALALTNSPYQNLMKVEATNHIREAIINYIKTNREKIEQYAHKNRIPIPSDYQVIFNAAESGDLKTTVAKFNSLSPNEDLQSKNELWLPMRETFSALEQLLHWDPILAKKHAHDILQCMPSNSIYIGRGFKPILEQDSRLNIYGLSSFQLVDWTYIKYVTDIYKNIQMPSIDEMSSLLDPLRCQTCQKGVHSECEYKKTAASREVKEVLFKSSSITTKRHELIAKSIIEKNKGQYSFYVCEYLPISVDWYYPYAKPAGLLIKIEKEPLASLAPEVINQDRNFWNRYTKELLSMKAFRSDMTARISFAQLRYAIGNLYEYRGLKEEAEHALKQALALSPHHWRAICKLAYWSIEQNQMEEALRLVEDAVEVLMSEPWKDSASKNPAPINSFVQQIKYEAAYRFFRNRKYERALKLLEEAKSITPLNAVNYTQHVNLLIQRIKFEWASAIFEDKNYEKALKLAKEAKSSKVTPLQTNYIQQIDVLIRQIKQTINKNPLPSPNRLFWLSVI